MAVTVEQHQQRVAHNIQLANVMIGASYLFGAVFVLFAIYYGFKLLSLEVFSGLGGLALAFYILGLSLLFVRDLFVRTEERFDLIDQALHNLGQDHQADQEGPAQPAPA